MCAREWLGSESEYYNLNKKIKKMRLLHGETQEELAQAIGVTKNAICNYEQGYRTPTIIEMRKIAKHFNMTLHGFLRGDYMDVELPKNSPINDLEFQENAFEKLLPFVWIEDDLEDNDCQKAFESLQKLAQFILYQPDSFDWSQIEECVELYEKAAEKEILSAYVGLLWLAAIQAFIISLCGTKVGELGFNTSTDVNFKAFIKAYYLSSVKDSIDPELEQEKTEMMIKLQRDIFQNIYYLKNAEVSNLSSLADYYLAILHLFNLLENGLSREENRLIGRQMLEICYILHNEYAIDFKTQLYPSEPEDE